MGAFLVIVEASLGPVLLFHKGDTFEDDNFIH